MAIRDTIAAIKQAFVDMYNSQPAAFDPAITTLSQNFSTVLCRFTIGTDAPSGGAAGDFYYRNQNASNPYGLYFRNNTGWVEVSVTTPTPPPP